MHTAVWQLWRCAVVFCGDGCGCVALARCAVTYFTTAVQQTMHAVVVLSDVGRVCWIFHHSAATFIVLL